MTDKWLRIWSFPSVCFGIYAGNEARGRLCVEALCRMVQTGTP